MLQENEWYGNNYCSVKMKKLCLGDLKSPRLHLPFKFSRRRLSDKGATTPRQRPNLKHIEPLVPSHLVYTEAFCGGAALYWAKKPADIEVLNDINGNLINFYKVLKCHFNELKEKIETTLHSREIFDFASIVYDYPQFFDPVTRAWALWVKSKMGFASMLDGTFGYDKTTNSMCKKIENSKDQFTIALQKRIERTQIECGNALHLIESRDCVDAFHFIDPPYINSDCGHYADTFNLMNFEELLTMCEGLKGKFMLTMFPHETLKEYIVRNDWHLVTVERTITVSTVNRRKQEEWIVMNYTKPHTTPELFD